MIGNLNIKTKKFDFEKHLLIGWVLNTVKKPANQDAHFKVQHFCFYVKVVYHLRPDYYSIYSSVYCIQYIACTVFKHHCCIS